MADVFSEDKRSQIMAGIHGRGNKSTEGRFRNLLDLAGFVGWRDHPRDVYGSPDFVFDAQRVAVFVDGCFWHGCDVCRNIPTSNADFWLKKIQTTRVRDDTVNRTLEASGWRVVRFWEHDLKKKNQETVVARLHEVLAR